VFSTNNENDRVLRYWSIHHNSLEAIQVMVEAKKRTYADRSYYLGDPGFVNILIMDLLDTSYLNKRTQRFSFETITPSDSIS
jgi:gamma-glutamyltranspeptidase/glutathione hydrolase